MPVDPVCGMAVEPEDAAGTSSYRRQAVHFCRLARKASAVSVVTDSMLLHVADIAVNADDR